MSAERIAGIIALSSGVLLVVALVAAAFVGPTAFANTSSGYAPMGPGMMGAGHMGTGMGHEMMGFGPSGPAASAIPGAPEVRVQAANSSFTPSEIRLPKGTVVNLTLTNPASTGIVHDLTIPALAIHLVANFGETRSIGLRDLAAGQYNAHCGVPGHAELGMRAIVIVE